MNPPPGPTSPRPPPLRTCIPTCPPCPLLPFTFCLFPSSPHSPRPKPPRYASRFTLHEMRKQTQFQIPQNHRNSLFHKALPQYPTPRPPKKQTQFKSRQSRDPDAHPDPTRLQVPTGPIRSPLHAPRFTLHASRFTLYRTNPIPPHAIRPLATSARNVYHTIWPQL